MREEIIAQRTFELRDADGGNVDVVAKLYSFGGQAPYFSLTSQNGCDHERILAAAPPEVKEDLEILAAVHLARRTGEPTHAVNNTAYALEQGRFRDAHGSLGGIVPIEEVHKLHTSVLAFVDSEKAMEDWLEAAAVQARKAQIEACAGERYLKTYAHERGAGKDKWPKAVRDRYADAFGKLKAFFGDKPFKDRGFDEAKFVAAAAEGRFPSEAVEGARVRLRAAAFRSMTRKFADEFCAPLWAAQAEAAEAALRKPAFRAEGRPARVDDPTTWEGFIAKWGLRMTAVRSKPLYTDMKYAWDCEVATEAGSFTVNFGNNNGTAPDLRTVLECLQSDFASVHDKTVDEWIEEMGVPDKVADLRRLERGFAAAEKEAEDFRRITGGEEAYRDLLTSVGDGAPFSKDYFESAAPAPR